MSNNGKIIYGGEAFEQNTDPSPGLGMGEIRYFVNPPDDPRWLRCDGNIHKRSTYSAYAATRPLPAWRFSSRVEATYEHTILSSIPDNNKCIISETRTLLVTEKYDNINNTWQIGLFLYDSSTGDFTLIHDNSSESYIISQEGSFYKIGGITFYICDQGIWEFNSVWEVETIHDILIDTSNMVLTRPILTRNNSYVAFISDNSDNMVSSDGINFTRGELTTPGLDPLQTHYAFASPLDYNYTVLLSGFQGRNYVYILQELSANSLYNYYHAYASYITDDISPKRDPVRVGNRIISFFRNNTLSIIDENTDPYSPADYRDSNLDGHTTPMFVIGDDILFFNGPEPWSEVTQLGFLQTDLKTVEKIDMLSHHDIVNDSNLYELFTEYQIYKDDDSIYVPRSFVNETTSKYYVRLYFENSNDDFSENIEIYKDNTMFHAPGMSPKLNSWPYVWTGD